MNHFYVLQNELWMCINSTLPGKQVKPRHPDADLLLYLTTNQNKICLQTVAPASVGAAHADQSPIQGMTFIYTITKCRYSGAIAGSKGKIREGNLIHTCSP